MTRIIKLEAENIKKIKAIEITPQGELIILSGKNAQGKTTILDCILWALEGKANIQGKPIREGEEKGNITLHLEDMIITRKFKYSKEGKVQTILEVYNKEGFKFESPQAMLDKLLGSLSLDPLAFSKMKPKEQRESLLKILNLDIDLDELEEKRLQFYNKRTEANREAKRLEGAISEIEVPEGTPDEEVEVSKLMRDLNLKKEVNAKYSANGSVLRTLTNEMESLELELKTNKEKKEKLIKENKNLKTYPPEEIENLEKEINKSSEVNKNVEAKKRKNSLKEKSKEELKKSEDFSDEIKKIDQEKEDSLRKVKMPVSDLEIGEEELLLNKIPISQISDSEKLRLSCAIAMSSNSELKVLRVKEGSNLDNKGLEILSEMAKEKNYQIWLEKVDESGKVGIVIEEGKVKTINNN